MKEALKLALDFIERTSTYLPTSFDGDGMNIHAILKEALAEQDLQALHDENVRLGLYEPEQEPVAWMSPSWIDPDTRGWQSDSFESIPIEGWLPLYTTPPQRTWVGLSDEERGKVYKDWRWSEGRTSNLALCKDIEAKLKEKNQ